MIHQSSNHAAATAALSAYEDEILQQCFAHGYNAAHGLVCHNTPSMGSRVQLPDEIHPVEVTPDNFLVVVEQLAWAAEEHARQFSPWEQVASWINSLPGDDSLVYWSAYEEGVALAITHDMEGLEYGVH